MQYLYVLTSTPKDNYYEQFLLSLTSLRLVMPKANVILLCDNITKSTLTGKRALYEKLISSIITVDAPFDLSQIEISRWLKTSMRRHIKGDFLFIDCDTIITDDLSSVFDLDINFGACLDKHSLINRHFKKSNIINNDKKLTFFSYKTNKHYNSGVIFCKDSAKATRIMERWHELWLYSKTRGILRDQPAFNMSIYESASQIYELDGIWNCQIAHNGLPYLANSKIIHYFATDLFAENSPYILASNKILNSIKETGEIPDEALNHLKNPRSAFSSESRIISGDTLYVLSSNYFEYILFIKRKLPLLFKIKDGFFAILKNIAKLFVIKSSKKKDGGIRHYR